MFHKLFLLAVVTCFVVVGASAEAVKRQGMFLSWPPCALGLTAPPNEKKRIGRFDLWRYVDDRPVALHGELIVAFSGLYHRRCHFVRRERDL